MSYTTNITNAQVRQNVLGNNEHKKNIKLLDTARLHHKISVGLLSASVVTSIIIFAIAILGSIVAPPVLPVLLAAALTLSVTGTGFAASSLVHNSLSEMKISDLNKKKIS
ncbi:MAG: hypothetical protein SP4CHLAM5_10350 [Chlamydiia bacterium]|nr:hypothetical protein [Chlamydiia bacterium]MCH9618892.1 hypothetical protein [Chlamydiia bacterium]MCH9624559.1 hypothetical protein [Chlamydiia bacterium]